MQSVSVTDILFLSQTICVCDRESQSVTDSLCLSQTVCVCQKICVCHGQVIQFFVFHTQFLSDSLCHYQTLFLIILGKNIYKF